MRGLVVQATPEVSLKQKKVVVGGAFAKATHKGPQVFAEVVPIQHYTEGRLHVEVAHLSDPPAVLLGGRREEVPLAKLEPRPKSCHCPFQNNVGLKRGGMGQVSVHVIIVKRHHIRVGDKIPRKGGCHGCTRSGGLGKGVKGQGGNGGVSPWPNL